MKIEIQDVEIIAGYETIKVNFPFYVKKISRYKNWDKTDELGEISRIEHRKFYDEFTYVEIEYSDKKQNIKLEFHPNGRWLEEGYELTYTNSTATNIKQALDNKDNFEVSTEEEFETALQDYKDYLNKITI